MHPTMTQTTVDNRITSHDQSKMSLKGTDMLEALPRQPPYTKSACWSLARWRSDLPATDHSIQSHGSPRGRWWRLTMLLPKTILFCVRRPPSRKVLL